MIYLEKYQKLVVTSFRFKIGDKVSLFFMNLCYNLIRDDIMEEIWKDIPDYKGYQVSNLGRVRTYNKITYTQRHGERHWKDRILKQKITVATKNKNRKDARVELWNNKEHKTLLVARLVAFTFNNVNLKSKLTVNHKDGNSLNNNLQNLEIITRKENIQHE